MDDTNFQAASDSFVQWLLDNGATINPDIQLQDLRSQGRGRGVVATKALDVDTTLFRIPRSLILLPNTSTLPESIREALIDDPWLALIAAMIHEHRQPSETTASTSSQMSPSSWHQYLRVLPEAFDTLMFWSDEELDHLQASAVRRQIGRSHADEQFLNQLVPHFCEQAASHPNASELPEVQLFITEAHVMASRIMAYAFDIEPPTTTKPNVNGSNDDDSDDGYATDVSEADLPKGMVPLADMLNADADRNNARLFYGQDFLEMRTIRSVEAGEELFNDYGPLPRSDLLRRYGYVSERYAQYDVAEISLENLLPSHGGRLAESPEGGDGEVLDPKKLEERISFLRDDLELDVDGWVISRAPSSPDTPGDLTDIFDEELLLFVNTIVAPSEQFARLQKKRKPAASLPPVPNSDEPTAVMLRGALRRRLAEYPTTIQHDRQKLKNELSVRERMAIHVRLGEKEVLQAALDVLGKGSVLESDTDGEENDNGRAKKRARII